MGRVIDLLHRLGKHDCLVGRSGDKWVGVYSGECEDTAGRSTPKFALDISNNLEDDVLGLGLYEEEFKYWLFNRGKLIDQFPPGGIASFFIKYRKHRCYFFRTIQTIVKRWCSHLSRKSGENHMKFWA